MSKTLTTFSGKYGDILWSLATVRAIAHVGGQPVDFACMPQYKTLLPMLNEQPYIDKAYVLDDWKLFNSNHGDQPWNPPSHTKCIAGQLAGAYQCKEGYERCWHLGYRGHPGLFGNENSALIDFCAHQQGIRFTENPLPFLAASDVRVYNVGMNENEEVSSFAYAFNEQYADLKERFLAKFQELMGQRGTNVTGHSWSTAASIIKSAKLFVGCRSANYVLAHGVAQKIICYEPHPARHASGNLGVIFGCPYGREQGLPFNLPPETQAEVAAAYAKEIIQENEHANA